MAQSGFTPIQIYSSSTASNVPLAANLTNSTMGAELAINIADGKLFYKDSGGAVQVLASKAGALGSVTSVAMTVPSFLSVSGSPITSSGTLAVTLSGTALPTANGGTGAVSAPSAMANLMGFTTTATAAGTTTLTNSSSMYQLFTGTSTQTVVLPVTSTLTRGWTFHICNNSTGVLTVNSSGGNLVITIPANTTAMATCVATGGTTASDWEQGLTDFGAYTGSGSVVLSSSPTLVTPALGTPASGNFSTGTFTWPTFNQNTTGSSATFTSTSQNSQFNSIGVGTPGSTTAGEIRATNNITAYYSSDRRLKENIKEVDNALDIVCAIGSKTFDWTDEYIASKGGEDGYFVQKSDFGVVAQDVQEVFPQAVRTREDGTLAVDYEKLATLSFGAIKSLLARVEALEAK